MKQTFSDLEPKYCSKCGKVTTHVKVRYETGLLVCRCVNCRNVYSLRKA